MEGSAHPNGVVLCLIDHLGPEGLARLPRSTAVLERFAASKLGTAHGPDEGAAYYAIGTGLHRPQIAATLDALIEAGSLRCAAALESVFEQAEFRRGNAVDLMTDIETPRCTVHVFAHVASQPEQNRHLYELVDALTANGYPFVVHAIVGDHRAPASAPQEAVQEALEHLEHRFAGVGRFATVMGSSWALGAELDWDRAFAAFEAIVHGEDVESAETVFRALEFAYGAERVDATIEPVRIGDYSGVAGGLRTELPADAPTWAWHGEDVGIVWVPRGEDATPLVSLLLGTDLPAHAAERISRRGRAQYAFEHGHLASLASLGAIGLPAIVDSAATAPSLLESLAARGKRCRVVFDPSRRSAVSWSLEGDRDAIEGARTDEGADAASALALATEGVKSGELDFQVVAVSGAVPEQIDEGLESLARTVIERGGALVVVADGAIRVAAEGPAASAAAPTELREVFRLAHDLLGVAVHDATTEGRRARRRR